MEGLRPTGVQEPPNPGLLRDQAKIDSICGGDCGCISCSGLGMDPLFVLSQRDSEVRTHENDHLTEAGEYAIGGPVYEFYCASDGRNYAVGGKVAVDMSEIAGDPEKTARKMAQIQRAALKPVNPSDQDRCVAAEAASLEAKALRQITEKAMREGAPIPLFH